MNRKHRFDTVLSDDFPLPPENDAYEFSLPDGKTVKTLTYSPHLTERLNQPASKRRLLLRRFLMAAFLKHSSNFFEINYLVRGYEFAWRTSGDLIAQRADMEVKLNGMLISLE